MAALEQSNNYYLELSKKNIRFDPVSAVTNVFFDDSNRQVFAVRSGGATGVVVKGPDETKNISFRMEDRGEVISIKFSHDMKVLAVQRSHSSVEFLNFENGEPKDNKEYSQSCRGKNTQIIAFNWTTINEILFVTNSGIELYQVQPEKCSLKLLKSHALSINWFVWLPESAVMLLSTGGLANVLHPFHFRTGVIMKYSKFEVDLPPPPKPGAKVTLQERDVIMGNIYAELYVIVLRHQHRTNGGSLGAEIGLYKLNKDSPTKKTHILRLDMSGRFAINIVDNLVVVHHQASRTSMIFDVKLSGVVENGVTNHHPVISPLPIKPFTFSLTPLPSASGVEVQEYNCELYSPNWIAFQPNVIIDAKLGCLWGVQLSLQPVSSMLPDKVRLVEFLLRRRDSKPVLLKVCQQMLTPGHQADLVTIATIFDKLNAVYWDYLQAEVQSLALDSNTFRTDAVRRRQLAIVDQSDMYTHVFSVFMDNKETHYKFMVAVLIEYIRSLNLFEIPVQHYFYELVINTLVQNNCFYQLHQFLQYHVLADSKPLACLMLSLEGVYAPAHQLALDMLKRLTTANEEIIEVLLSKQQLLTALRFVRSVGATDTVSARKFLEAAKSSDDKHIFYTVFRFFEQRNVRLRGEAKFPTGEHCEQYVSHFHQLFGKDVAAAS